MNLCSWKSVLPREQHSAVAPTRRCFFQCVLYCTMNIFRTFLQRLWTSHDPTLYDVRWGEKFGEKTFTLDSLRTFQRCIPKRRRWGSTGCFKGNRQRERRGFGKVSNIRNMSQTAAIEVLFFFNFAVIFDFMYFRFRPSKANWIGDVLTIRQNAANTCSVSFFEVISILKTEHHCLRQYIDATMNLAPLGKAQKYCSVYNFQLVFRGLFFC